MCALIAVTGNCELTSVFLYFIQQENVRKQREIHNTVAAMKAVVATDKYTGELKFLYKCTIDQELVVTAAYRRR